MDILAEDDGGGHAASQAGRRRGAVSGVTSRF